MKRSFEGRWPRGGRAMAIAALGLALLGCASEPQKIEAINAVNQGFRAAYEQVLAERGTRVFAMPRDEAFVAMRVALAGLGLRTVRQDVSLGYLLVSAPAPQPLNDDEWRRHSETDLPLLRRLIEPHVGIASNLVQFEPQGLDVLISATMLPAGSGTEVSLTVRLQETAPPRSGWPRREYISPTVVRAGLDKIWNAYEQELRAAPSRR